MSMCKSPEAGMSSPFQSKERRAMWLECGRGSIVRSTFTRVISGEEKDRGFCKRRCYYSFFRHLFATILFWILCSSVTVSGLSKKAHPPRSSLLHLSSQHSLPDALVSFVSVTRVQTSGRQGLYLIPCFIPVAHNYKDESHLAPDHKSPQPSKW